jgi:hypothetical protein
LSNRISIKKQTKWIQLTLYSNCFEDGEKTHLGFKHKGIYYCLTHSRSPVLVPEKYLKMNHVGNRDAYVAIARSTPVSINKTNMRISKLFFYNAFLKQKN